LFKERAISIIKIIKTITKRNVVETITIKRTIERNLNSKKIKIKSSLAKTRTITIKSKKLLK